MDEPRTPSISYLEMTKECVTKLCGLGEAEKECMLAHRSVAEVKIF